MRAIKPDVAAICVGRASSIAAVLLVGGARGKRHALPHARMMVHQVSAELQGTAIDIDIQAREIPGTTTSGARICRGHTGQDLERIRTDIQRDYFMSSGKAVEYGLIDEVLIRGKG